MRQREDVACIVYSSGTGGRPKGCVLTHENYLEPVPGIDRVVSILAGVRYLSILPTNHAIDLWWDLLGRLCAEHAWCICGRCVRNLFGMRLCATGITYVSLVPMIVKNLERGLRAKFDELPGWRRAILNRLIGVNKLLTRSRARVKVSRTLLPQVHRAFGGECWH